VLLFIIPGVALVDPSVSYSSPATNKSSSHLTPSPFSTFYSPIKTAIFHFLARSPTHKAQFFQYSTSLRRFQLDPGDRSQMTSSTSKITIQVVI
jgi:hypothetical protein